MKVKSVEIVNFKAIKSQEAVFNGNSAIVTGANNLGKSSLTKGLIDRFRSEIPDKILNEESEKGSNTMRLTDGSKIEWTFSKGKDEKEIEKFSFTTADDIKMTTGVLSAIGHKYFGVKFDIDEFMSASRANALKMVQTLLGIDFTDHDAKYKKIFDERTDANRDLKNTRALKLTKPVEVEEPNIEALKAEKNNLISENTSTKEKWTNDNAEFQKESLKFNATQEANYKRRVDFLNDWEELEKYVDDSHEIEAFIDFEGIRQFYEKMELPLELKEIKTLDEPKYHTFEEIDDRIEQAYTNKASFDTYETNLKAYNDWVEKGLKEKKKVDSLTEKLEKLNDEKLKLIKDANLPSEFEMTDEGLLYKGYHIDNNQISSSAKYICALKLGALSLGKIRTMHFDCSFLDKNSLAEIMEWAETEDLQLLIERVDIDGGDIKYEIIEK